jgi:hypothetical protein
MPWRFGKHLVGICVRDQALQLENKGNPDEDFVNPGASHHFIEKDT